MKKVILLPAVLVWFLIVASPAWAMMEGMHGGMHSGSGSENAEGMQQPGEKQTWHRHGEYYHSHEGGELPHSHYQKSGATESAPEKSSVKKNVPRETPPSEESVQKQEISTALPKSSSEDKSTKVASQASRLPVLNWKDDMVLHKVPTGKLALGAESRQVESFYMDETQVTNHQYVEFLNQVLPRIHVERGVVKGDDKIWLLLGEVTESLQKK